MKKLIFFLLLISAIFQIGLSQTHDAFGRLRTSNTGQRMDVEFIYDKQVEFYDEVTVNGTVTFNSTGRDLTLSLSDANVGTCAGMSSYPVPYTPGNSQLIDLTGVLDLSEIDSGYAEVFLRSNSTGTVIEKMRTQAQWMNLNDGVHWHDSHIFQIDFQSLKVGKIRYGLIKNGVFVQVSEFKNDNLRNDGFWESPSLPAFWRIYNTATQTIAEIGYGDTLNAVGFRYILPIDASATMKAICATVKSEGGMNIKDLDGLPRAIDNGVTPVTVSTTLIPILSIRVDSLYKTNFNLGIIVPKFFSISTDNPIRLLIVEDAVLTNESWVDVDANNSCVEYDISATAYTGGRIIYSDYIETTGNNRGTRLGGILGKSVLWKRRGVQTGILTIVAVKTGAQNAAVLSSINWDEIR